MGGDGKDVPFLLLQFADGVDSRVALEGLWAVIEGVNGKTSGDIRLEREMIYVAGKEKGFVKVGGKATTNRRATISLLEGEIEELYRLRAAKMVSVAA